jgi:hypothetical protein
MDYDLPDHLPGTASGPDSFGYNFLDDIVKGMSKYNIPM